MVSFPSQHDPLRVQRLPATPPPTETPETAPTEAPPESPDVEQAEDPEPPPQLDLTEITQDDAESLQRYMASDNKDEWSVSVDGEQVDLGEPEEAEAFVRRLQQELSVGKVGSARLTPVTQAGAGDGSALELSVDFEALSIGQHDKGYIDNLTGELFLGEALQSFETAEEAERYALQEHTGQEVIVRDRSGRFNVFQLNTSNTDGILQPQTASIDADHFATASTYFNDGVVSDLNGTDLFVTARDGQQETLIAASGWRGIEVPRLNHDLASIDMRLQVSDINGLGDDGAEDIRIRPSGQISLNAEGFAAVIPDSAQIESLASGALGEDYAWVARSLADVTGVAVQAQPPGQNADYPNGAIDIHLQQTGLSTQGDGGITLTPENDGRLRVETPNASLWVNPDGSVTGDGSLVSSNTLLSVGVASPAAGALLAAADSSSEISTQLALGVVNDYIYYGKALAIQQSAPGLEQLSVNFPPELADLDPEQLSPADKQAIDQFLQGVDLNFSMNAQGELVVGLDGELVMSSDVDGPVAVADAEGADWGEVHVNADINRLDARATVDVNAGLHVSNEEAGSVMELVDKTAYRGTYTIDDALLQELEGQIAPPAMSLLERHKGQTFSASELRMKQSEFNTGRQRHDLTGIPEAEVLVSNDDIDTILRTGENSFDSTFSGDVEVSARLSGATSTRRLDQHHLRLESLHASGENIQIDVPGDGLYSIELDSVDLQAGSSELGVFVTGQELSLDGSLSGAGRVQHNGEEIMAFDASAELSVKADPDTGVLEIGAAGQIGYLKVGDVELRDFNLHDAQLHYDPETRQLSVSSTVGEIDVRGKVNGQPLVLQSEGPTSIGIDVQLPGEGQRPELVVQSSDVTLSRLQYGSTQFNNVQASGAELRLAQQGFTQSLRVSSAGDQVDFQAEMVDLKSGDATPLALHANGAEIELSRTFRQGGAEYSLDMGTGPALLRYGDSYLDTDGFAGRVHFDTRSHELSLSGGPPAADGSLPPFEFTGTVTYGSEDSAELSSDPLSLSATGRLALTPRENGLRVDLAQADLHSLQYGSIEAEDLQLRGPIDFESSDGHTHVRLGERVEDSADPISLSGTLRYTDDSGITPAVYEAHLQGVEFSGQFELQSVENEDGESVVQLSAADAEARGQLNGIPLDMAMALTREDNGEYSFGLLEGGVGDALRLNTTEGGVRLSSPEAGLYSLEAESLSFQQRDLEQLLDYSERIPGMESTMQDLRAGALGLLKRNDADLELSGLSLTLDQRDAKNPSAQIESGFALTMDSAVGATQGQYQLSRHTLAQLRDNPEIGREDLQTLRGALRPRNRQSEFASRAELESYLEDRLLGPDGTQGNADTSDDILTLLDAADGQTPLVLDRELLKGVKGQISRESFRELVPDYRQSVAEATIAEDALLFADEEELQGFLEDLSLDPEVQAAILAAPAVQVDAYATDLQVSGQFKLDTADHSLQVSEAHVSGGMADLNRVTAGVVGDLTRLRMGEGRGQGEREVQEERMNRLDISVEEHDGRGMIKVDTRGNGPFAAAARLAAFEAADRMVDGVGRGESDPLEHADDLEGTEAGTSEDEILSRQEFRAARRDGEVEGQYGRYRRDTGLIQAEDGAIYIDPAEMLGEMLGPGLAYGLGADSADVQIELQDTEDVLTFANGDIGFQMNFSLESSWAPLPEEDQTAYEAMLEDYTGYAVMGAQSLPYAAYVPTVVEGLETAADFADQAYVATERLEGQVDQYNPDPENLERGRDAARAYLYEQAGLENPDAP